MITVKGGISIQRDTKPAQMPAPQSEAGGGRRIGPASGCLSRLESGAAKANRVCCRCCAQIDLTVIVDKAGTVSVAATSRTEAAALAGLDKKLIDDVIPDPEGPRCQAGESLLISTVRTLPSPRVEWLDRPNVWRLSAGLQRRRRFQPRPDHPRTLKLVTIGPELGPDLM